MKTIANDTDWTRIRDLEIDGEDIALPFSQRLARENGWDQIYADRMVAEYKRFVYLAVSQELPVTPSDEVDQAWHLHLAYSRHYWEDLCDKALGKQLHHDPTEGGESEQDKFEEWYSRTLELYKEVFEETPPPDIWPNPTKRFKDVDAFRRVNTTSNIILNRRKCSVNLLVPGMLIFPIGLLSESVLGVVFGIGLVLLALYLGHVPDKKAKSNGGGGGGGGCGGGGCGGCGGGGGNGG